MSSVELKPRPLCVVLFQGNTMCFPIREENIDDTSAKLAEAMKTKTVVAFRSHAWERWVIRGDLVIGWYFVPEDITKERATRAVEKLADAESRGNEWRDG